MANPRDKTRDTLNYFGDVDANTNDNPLTIDGTLLVNGTEFTAAEFLNALQMNMGTGQVNPTSTFIPYNLDGAFEDLPASYDSAQNLVTTTANWQFPDQTVFLSENIGIGGSGESASIRDVANDRRGYLISYNQEVDATPGYAQLTSFNTQTTIQGEKDSNAGSTSYSEELTLTENRVITKVYIETTDTADDVEVFLLRDNTEIGRVEGISVTADTIIEVDYPQGMVCPLGTNITLGIEGATLKGNGTPGVDFELFLQIDWYEFTQRSLKPVVDTETTTNNTWSSDQISTEIDDRIQTAIDNLTPNLPMPSFTAFAVDIANSVADGTVITGSHTFTWAISDIQNVSGDLTISQAGTELSSSVTAADLTVDLTVNDITLNEGDSLTFSIEGTNNQAGTFSRNYVIRVPRPHEFSYSGRAATDDSTTVDVSTLDSVDITGSGHQFNVTRPTGSVGDFFYILTPNAEPIGQIRDSTFNQIVFDSSFTADNNAFVLTENARQVNGEDYNTYVLGPLARTTAATYEVTIA